MPVDPPHLILQKPSAIVLGFDCITGLQIARQLHRFGVQVTGLVANPGHFTAASRAVQRVVALGIEDPQLLPRLIDLAEPCRPVLIPATDAAVKFLCAHTDALAPHFRSAVWAPDAVRRALGKIEFAAEAERHALPVPRTAAVRSLPELRAAAAALRSPYVLKPDHKTPDWDRGAPTKIIEADSPEALEIAYATYRHACPAFVVQEWIRGGDDAMYSYYVFAGRDGRIVADCLAHKLRQWPRNIGSGTLAEVSRDPELIEIGRRVLDRLALRGFVSVQMKRDAVSGEVAIIEVNVGRPAMGSFLSEAAGIDMLHLAYQEIAGAPASAAPALRHPDARWTSLKRDHRAALSALRSGELSIRTYLHQLRGIRGHAVWSRRDPMPFLLDLLRTPAKLGAQRRPRPVPARDALT